MLNTKDLVWVKKNPKDEDDDKTNDKPKESKKRRRSGGKNTDGKLSKDSFGSVIDWASFGQHIEIAIVLQHRTQIARVRELF